MSAAIHQEVSFKATPKRVYDALMTSKEHSAFTGGAAKISRDAGGEFSCHDGQVTGRNVELVPGQRIVQAWRLAAWEEGLYSLVRFELQPKGGETRLVLDHVGVPEPFREGTASGWETRYWGPLKKHLAN
jgi:activator of HSP90 ATPase